VNQQGDGKAPTTDARHDAEVRQLREAVEDLEVQIRDLEEQLAAISKARVRGDAASGELGQTAVPAISGPSPAGGTTALLKRTAKRAIRGTLGVARLVWGAADPAQRHVVAVRPARDRAAELPRLTIVVESDEIPEELVPQTIERLEVALWNRREETMAVLTLDGVEMKRSTVRNRGEMLELVTGDYLLDLPSGAPPLPATLLERLQWVAASEKPLFVRVLSSYLGGADSDQGVAMILASREVWAPDVGVDLDRLAEAAGSRPLVGKTVGLAGDMDVAVPRLGSLGPGSRGMVCRTGRYDVWALNRTGPVEHRVLRLPIGPGSESGFADRPAVLVVAAASLTAGFDDLVAGVVGALVEHVLPVVATTAAESALDLRRAAHLERLDVPVYELGSTLDPSAWPSAIERIAKRYEIDKLVVVGNDARVGPAVEALRDRGVGVVSLPAIDDSVPPGWPMTTASEPVPAVRGRAVRFELGVPEDRFLVVTAADLVEACRPEDLVAVAERFRDQPDTVFMLVGEGPLAGNVLDLVRYLDLDNVRLRGPVHELGDLAAAADLVVDVSENAAVRPALAAAIAAGTPVVATPGAGLRELIESTGATGLVVGRPGDPAEIADAIRRIRGADRSPTDLAEAGRALSSWRQAGADVLRAAVLGSNPTPTGE